MIDYELSIRRSARINYVFTTVFFLVLAFFVSYLNSILPFLRINLNAFHLALLFLWILSMLYYFVRAKTTILDLSDEGVSYRWGIINKKSIFLNYKKIDNFRIHKPALKMLFGLGDLQIDTTGGVGIEINAVDLPSKYLTMASKMLRKRIGGKKDADKDKGSK